MRQNAALFPEARSTLAVITAFSMVINVLGLTGAIYMLQVYDRVLSSFSLPTLVVLSAIAAVLFATQGIIIALRGVLTARLADRLLVHNAAWALAQTARDASEGPTRKEPRPEDARTPIEDLEIVAHGVRGGGLAAALDAPWAPVLMAPQLYMEALLELLQAHSLRRSSIDWPSFRAELLTETAGCETVADTYAAIRSALRRLGDGHSWFMAPAEVAARAERRPPSPRGERLGRVAYLAVPWFAANRHVSETQLAQHIQRLVAELDTADTVGWVVDLRENRGGNMWPMLAGLGPLLGEGVSGFFTAPGEPDLAWSYRKGAASLGARVLVRVDGKPYQLRTPAPPVAVLTGPATTSVNAAQRSLRHQHAAVRGGKRHDAGRARGRGAQGLRGSAPTPSTGTSPGQGARALQGPAGGRQAQRGHRLHAEGWLALVGDPRRHGGEPHHDRQGVQATRRGWDWRSQEWLARERETRTVITVFSARLEARDPARNRWRSYQVEAGERLSAGEALADLARTYGVSASTISRLRIGRDRLVSPRLANA